MSRERDGSVLVYARNSYGQIFCGRLIGTFDGLWAGSSSRSEDVNTGYKKNIEIIIPDKTTQIISTRKNKATPISNSGMGYE